MNSGLMPRFRSSGQRGFSSGIDRDPRHVVARKLEREVQVRFTSEACRLQTPEGMVNAQPGDAILTGIAGEHWRVSRAHFADKYQAKPPTRPGEPGTYVSRRNRILALQMQEPFEVLLSDGQSTLSGRASDWLVDYGDGSLGIVAQPIFAITYEIID